MLYRYPLTRVLFLLGAAILTEPQTSRAAIEEQPADADEQQTEAKAKRPAPKLTRPPQLLEFEAAAYPPTLLKQDIGGEVLLHIDIDAEGLVKRVAVQSASEPAFAEPAMVAATRFVFSAAQVDHQPSAVRIEYRYVFEPLPQVPDAPAEQPDVLADGKAGVEQPPEPINFAGRVREAGTRKPIAGAVLTIDGSPAAETGADGTFAVRGVAPGMRTVKVRGLFHEAYEVQEEITPDERFEVSYYLLPISRNPYETVVRTRVERREVSKVRLEREELSKVPGTFGDPVRVVENLPGMARTPGGLGGALLVRGARPQDSAVFIDGVQVPLLYHFGGLTSVINAEFLERIDFFPGGFGARYGRATAGIVDVITRDLQCETVRGSAKSDFMDAAAFLCAPVGTWKVAVAARRSYIDALLPPVLDQIPREEDEGVMTLSPVYWDYQAKARTVIGRHAIDIFAFGADDKLKLVQAGSAEDLNVNFGMHLTSHRLLLRHTLSLGDGVTLTSSVAPGLTRQRMLQRSEEIGLENRFGLEIWSAEWRETLTAKLSDWLTLSGGLDTNFGSADLGMDIPAMTDLRRFPTPTFDFTASQPYDTTVDAFGHAYWIEAEIEPAAGLKLVPGLRLERFDFHKTQAIELLPRLTARYEVMPGSTAKAAYGRYGKLPEPGMLFEGFGNPRLDPELSHHVIVGFEQQLPALVDLDVQAFYIARSRLPTQSLDVTYVEGKAIRDNFSSDGTGYSYGLEVLLRRLASPQGRFYGWIAYTLSRSLVRDRMIDTTYAPQGGMAGGELAEEKFSEYLSPFDQTHILTVVAQWLLPWGLEAGLRFRFVSGNPYTPLRQGVVFFDADADRHRLDMRDVERNSGRLPPFHQLDVRVDKTFTFDLWKLTLYLEVLNAYWAKNVESYRYDYRFRQRAPLTFLPIVPVLGFKGAF